MSINTLCDVAYSGYDNDAIVTLNYLLGQIDYNKLSQRVKYAREFYQKEVKCVLLEYTSERPRRGEVMRYIQCIPGTDLEINRAFVRREFLLLAERHFLNNISGLTLYTRQKIGKSGVPVVNRRQLVLKIEAGALGIQQQPAIEELDDSISYYTEGEGGIL
jgi:hypothetical protein